MELPTVDPGSTGSSHEGSHHAACDARAACNFRLAPWCGRDGTSKHYSLPATPQNVQWGWYDPNEKPRLVVNSGDTISIETISHSLGQIKPGVDMGEIVNLRKENDGGGPHSITGPIYVTGAEPGDTLEVRILRIVPKADAFNFNLPGKEFPTVGLLGRNRTSCALTNSIWRRCRPSSNPGS